jgi:transcriptional regulator with XRE-family HTH domain
MNDLQNRIEILIDKFELQPSAFADKCGIKRPLMSHILSGRNKASLQVVMQILEEFTNVNTDWLIFGNGDMLKDAKITPNNFSESEGSSNSKKDNTAHFLTYNNADKSSRQRETEEKELSSLKVSDNPKEVVSPPLPKQPAQVLLFFEDGTFESFVKKRSL